MKLRVDVIVSIKIGLISPEIATIIHTQTLLQFPMASLPTF